MKEIYNLVREAKQSYQQDEIEVVEGWDFSQYDTLLLCDLMLNSRYQSGMQDALGRDKPFRNIVKFRRNVSVRATDIDTKDVQVKASRPTKKARWNSFVLQLKLKEWMKQNNFAEFLNKSNEYRASYGSAIVKKIERDGELSIEVVPWSNLITDQKDVFAAPIIQRHFLSPKQLRAKKQLGWDEDFIEELIEQSENKSDKRTHASDQDVEDSKTLGNFIEIFEIHGEFPETYIDEDGEEENYTNQMHIISTEYKINDKEMGCTLYAGEEDELPYKKVDWDTQDGRALGVGVIEDLFEHQIWTNYIVKQEKDMIDLASTIMYKRAPGTEGDATNILTDVLPGEILEDDIVRINDSPTSFPALENLITDWDTAASRQTSTFEAKTGELKPSNATFRGTAILNAEADSYYQYKIEGYAIFLKSVLKDWVIPHLVREIENDKEFAADLEPQELDTLDTLIAQKEANKKYLEEVFKGNVLTKEQYDQMVELEKATLQENGIRRLIKAPEDFMGDDLDVDILVSGEMENKAATFENLSSILNAVVGAQQPDGSNALLDDSRLSQIFSQIMENTGVLSPVSLKQASSQTSTNGLQLSSISNQLTPNTNE